MADIEAILNKYANAPEVGDDIEDLDGEGLNKETKPPVKPEKQEKMLPQSQVDKIVKERLERESKKYADYEDMKEIVKNLKEYGYKGETAAEIKHQVKQAVEIYKKEKEIEELQEEAEAENVSPKVLQKMKELERELAGLKEEKQQSEKIKKEAEEAARKEAELKEAEKAEFERMTEEFNAKYPDVNIEALANNPKFFKFAQRSNPNLSLMEIYEDYVELVGSAEAEALKKYQSKANRSTNSGKLNQSTDGGTYGLNPRQQALAKSAGMTNKEYAERLGRIKR
jgi:glutamyl/glutaminyl-tRNA synthetase